MCCSVFNHLLPQTPVCCHGNDSSTNTGLGLSGRRREIMNKQLCSIISNSMKKPQNAEFRWMRLSPCLNTSTGAAAPQRDSHSTQGSWAEWVLPGNAIYPAPVPVCPFSPCTDLSTGLDSAQSHRPLSSGMLRCSQGLPSSGGHYWSKEHLLQVQTMSCSSLQQIKAFKSFFF